MNSGDNATSKYHEPYRLKKPIDLSKQCVFDFCVTGLSIDLAKRLKYIVALSGGRPDFEIRNIS